MTIEDDLEEYNVIIESLEYNIRELEEELDEDENRKIIIELNALVSDQATRLGDCLEQNKILKMLLQLERARSLSAEDCKINSSGYKIYPGTDSKTAQAKEQLSLEHPEIEWDK